MQICKIEHINLSVGNVNETAKMLEFLFGWKIRWQGNAQLSGYTIHIGTDCQYLAIWAKTKEGNENLHHEKGKPLNHIGIEVEDLDAIEEKVRSLGFEPFSFQNYNPGRRFYFFDKDGIEYEIISYK
ncbi:MAG: VOC family protein [Caulobacterales bacterium]|nr:VOC family protein [Caulobacterales bacterium]